MPTTKEDLAQLTLLGSSRRLTDKIEVFPSHAPGMLEISLHCHEFTCLCPLTGQPDYAELEIDYVPDQWVAESKSVKLYLEKYRNVGIFHEHLAIELGDAFQEFVKPKSLTVKVRFAIRGGISITAKYSKQK